MDCSWRKRSRLTIEIAIGVSFKGPVLRRSTCCLSCDCMKQWNWSKRGRKLNRTWAWLKPTVFVTTKKTQQIGRVRKCAKTLFLKSSSYRASLKTPVIARSLLLAHKTWLKINLIRCRGALLSRSDTSNDWIWTFFQFILLKNPLDALALL